METYSYSICERYASAEKVEESRWFNISIISTLSAFYGSVLLWKLTYVTRAYNFVYLNNILISQLHNNKMNLLSTRASVPTVVDPC